jgi:hypothetical protein
MGTTSPRGRIMNARDEIYKLLNEAGYGQPASILAELLQYLDTDTIKDFTEHLYQMEYLESPEDADWDNDNAETDSYEEK